MLKNFTSLFIFLVLAGYCALGQNWPADSKPNEVEYLKKFGFSKNANLSPNISSKKGAKSRKSTASVANAYCVPVSIGTCTGGYISYVGIVGTTLSNPSACDNTTTSYTEFDSTNANQTASLFPGATYDLKVAVAVSGQVVSAWIDFDQNLVFDPNEWIDVARNSNAGDTLVVSFTVPPTAQIGSTGLRIRSRLNNNTNDSTSACLQFGSGESEDYSITINNPTNLFLSSFNPRLGVAGDVVTLSGYNFNGITGVKFNGTPANFTPGTSNQFTATVPAGATTGPITVTTATQSSTSRGKFHIGSLHIDSISPAAARAGYPLLIYCADGISGVIPQIDGIDCDSVRFDANLLVYKVKVPAGVSNGVVTIGSGRTLTTAPVNLVVVKGHYCVPHSPACAQFNNYISNVNITNTRFDNSSLCNDNLYFNSVVYAPQGNATTFLVYGRRYTLNVTPASAAQINAWIDYNGNGVYEASEYIFVSSYATSGTPASAQFTVPNGAFSGQVGMRIRTNSIFSSFGAATSACATYSNGETEDYIVTLGIPTTLTITDFDPQFGIPGDTVTINGYNLNRLSGVKFNGTTASFTSGTANRITAIVPPGATTGPIEIASATEADTSYNNFRIGLVQIDSVVPAAARAHYPVLIYSSNGFNGSIPKIDGIPFDSIYYDSLLLAYKALVPQGASAGVVTIGAGRRTSTAPNNLKIVAGNYCVPNSPACGFFSSYISNVKISNTRLNNSSACNSNQYFNSVVFAPGNKTTANLVNGRTYTLSVTPGQSSASIHAWIDYNGDGNYSASEYISVSDFASSGFPATKQFTVPTGTFNGQVGLRIRTNYTFSTFGAASSACSQYSTGETEDYLVNLVIPTALSITSFDPGFGLDGDVVTIKGYHLDRASTVKFNGTVATFTPGTANQITAVVPVGATTGPIVVAGATEADTSTSDFHVGVYHLDSISPASARVGYPVVIYSSDGIDGLIPKIDGIPFDSIIYDPTIRAYRAIVPHGVGAGVVSMGSGRSLSTTPNPLQIVSGSYCVPQSPSCSSFGFGNFITNVSVSNTTINNSSGCNTNLYYNQVVYAPGPNKTGLLLNGQTYTLNVTSSSSSSIHAWIDFDGNGLYDSSEYISVASLATGGVPNSVQFTVPFTSYSGLTGMRIRTNYSFSTFGAATSACRTYFTGETEDYLVRVGTPPNIYITDFTPLSGVPGDVVTLNGFHFDRVTGVRFNGQSAAFTVVSPNVITTTVPNGATTGYITAFGGTDTAKTATKFFIGNATLFDSLPVTTCNALFADHLAPNTTYQPTAEIIKTITPATPNQSIHLDWLWFNLRRPGDYLEIYDGPDIYSTLIGTYTGNDMPPAIAATNLAGQITLHFSSDTGVGNQGFGFTATCGPFPPAPAIDSVVPAAARPGYPLLIYVKNPKTGIDPLMDGLTIDQLNYDVSRKFYSGLVPQGVTNGDISITSGPNVSSGHIEILPGNYCAPQNSSCTSRPGFDNITKVSISSTSLNNSSDCDEYFSYNVIAYPPTGNKTANLTIRQTYTLSVTTNANNSILAWFDWNGDEDYSDNEFKRIASSSTAGRASTVRFKVPDSSIVGKVSIRIRSGNTFNGYGAFDACTNFFSGETEEYIVTVNNPAGLSPALSEGKAGIYPNPNNGEFSLNLQDIGNEGTLVIMDALGRTVYTRALNAADAVADAKFNANYLQAGVYSVQVTSGTKRLIERMVITK